MSWLKKKKEEEFKKYVPDVSKIKSEPESVELIDEPEEEVEEQEEVVEEIEEIDELESLKRKQKEVEEKIEQAKKKKIESRIMIVKELPESPIRRYRDKDGIVDLITIEEALGEILKILKE